MAHRSRFRVLLLSLLALLAVAGLVVLLVAGAMSSFMDMHERFAAVPPSLRSTAKHDPQRKSAVLLLGDEATVATDLLVPYRILSASGAFNVYVVGRTLQTTQLLHGVGIRPHFTFDELATLLPEGPDVVVVPAVMGPPGPETLAWLREIFGRKALVASICAGARVLGEAGILDGRRATTHWLELGSIASDHPSAHWIRGERYVLDENVLTTAGLTAAFDGSLEIVSLVAGQDRARETARAIGYPYDFEAVQSAWPQLAFADLGTVIRSTLAWPGSTFGIVLFDGIDELQLAAVIESYPRTFRVRIQSATDGGTFVTTRSGLVLVPSAAEAVTSWDRVVVPDQAGALDAALALVPADRIDRLGSDVSGGSAFAFDRVLRDISLRYGEPTAQFVSKQLEYMPERVPLP